MNKKIIKYLIWIILITATLILMPTKQAMATTTITYNTFKESENFFCLDKGQPFRMSETFEVSNISGDFEGIDRDKLEYIITEASTTYNGRTSIANYIPQHAIWKLIGTSFSSSEGDKLVAKANAYNNFVSNGGFSKVPRIEKEGTNKVVVYYYETTGSHNGRSGSYTNLNSVNITGASLTDTENCDYKGYNRKRIYTKNSGATQATVTVKYETSRDATLKLYDSNARTENVTYYKFNQNHSTHQGRTEFMHFDGTYYHNGCNISDQDNICEKYDIRDTEEGRYTQYICKACGATLEFSSGNISALLPNNVSGILEMYSGTSTEYPQDLLYGSGTISTSSKTETVKFGFDLTINKVDSLNKDSEENPLKLAGAKFKIDLTNVSAIGNYQLPTTGATQNSPKTVYVTTDNDGQIKLTGIIPSNPNSSVEATITELAPPNEKTGWHYLVNSTPTIVSMNYSNANASVTIKNDPYINLSGNVWEDGQIGEKGDLGNSYDGINNDGLNKLDGIIVELYNADAKGNKIGNRVDATTTSNGGSYKFENKRQTSNGYVVVFKYDGINYKATAKDRGNDELLDSDVDEKNRGTVNSNIKRISKGFANDTVPLSYKESEPILKVNIDGTNPANNNAADFQVEAHTGANKTSNDKITCGLVKKNFDIALGTDVKSATIKINGKTTEYTYAEIMNGALNTQFDEISSNTKRENGEDITYNLYLYSSDYNYRIKDYVTDLETDGKVNPQRPEAGYTETEGDNNTDRIKEIEAYVTYSVILKSQTTEVVTKTSTVEQFVYYYDDSVYSPIFAVNDIVDGYKVASIQGNKITLESVDSSNALTEGNSYRKEVNLTFKINEKEDGSLIVNKTATNIAEITRYSTSEGGLIDKDSAPENGIENGEIKQYEDDTDEAKGLNIVLRNDETRAIVGTVFADTDKNGNNTNGTNENGTVKYNEGVNDVIVQLIEIKKIGGKYYEYIWQETRSGSNEVKTTARNGYTGTTYTNSVTEAGKYEFKDFIPGNYIIRYIYGDGKTYDITSEEYKDSADNVKTYNGQDYKSTIDPNYNKPWYNTAGYTAGDSIARDNEARRLEVMAYSTTINGENGAHLANKTDLALEKTWMCAETSRINIPVDADNTSTNTNNTTASYDYTNKNTKVLFGDMNFGLALRPQENIVLEKHITSLKITPNGIGVQSIVDAKAEGIEKIVNGSEVKVEGLTSGLAIIKSTASERGFWQVATDVEELMQGAELEVEYTYVIRNDSEADYLSKILINAYEGYKTNEDGTRSDEKLGMTYEEYLNLLKYDTRGKMHEYGTYLGQVYYRGLNADGTEPDTDALVTSRVEKFEEALNNDLAFDETEGTSFKIARQASKENVYGVDKENGTKETEINTVVENVTVSRYLTPKQGEDYTTKTADWSKTIKLRTTLATVSGGELGANLPSYIAEVLQYSNAAGRKDMTATPANLGYVHSDDRDMTIERDNEQDEFWGESIRITKPTGEDKLTPIQIVLITIGAVAVLGVGIVLIKKHVLKK